LFDFSDCKQTDILDKALKTLAAGSEKKVKIDYCQASQLPSSPLIAKNHTSRTK
jgi:hypothetical protein